MQSLWDFQKRDGAAIYDANNSLTLVHCTLANNVLFSSPTNVGGGIAIGMNAAARISSCIRTGTTNANVVGKLIDEGNNPSSDSSLPSLPRRAGTMSIPVARSNG